MLSGLHCIEIHTLHLEFVEERRMANDDSRKRWRILTRIIDPTVLDSGERLRMHDHQSGFDAVIHDHTRQDGSNDEKNQIFYESVIGQAVPSDPVKAGGRGNEISPILERKVSVSHDSIALCPSARVICGVPQF